MLEIHASVDVASTPEVVWAVLTDFARFRSWNPFIRQAHGTVRVGAVVRVRVRSSIGMPLVFQAKVVHCYPARELRWRGHVVADWLARGEHAFTIESIDRGHVRFAQHEIFTGILPWLAGRLLVRETQRGFEAMNAALKARAEGA